MNIPDTFLFDLIKREWTPPSPEHLMTLISSIDIWKLFLFVSAAAVLTFGGASGKPGILSLLIGLLIGIGIGIGLHSLRLARRDARRFSVPRPKERPS